MSPNGTEEPDTAATAGGPTIRRTRRLHRWRAALVPVALVSPLALTACGGSDDAGASSTRSDGAAAQEGGQASGGRGGPNMEGLQEYLSCLEEHGVTLPERGEAGQPPDGANGAMPEPPAGADGEMPRPLADGEMPDPPADGERPEPPADGQAPPDGPARSRGGMFGLDTSDATVKAAMDECADLEPEMPPGGPGRDGGGPGRQDRGGDQGQQDGGTSTTTSTTVAAG